MILILYHKYYYFLIYIFSQSCFSESENDKHLGMEGVLTNLASCYTFS